MSGLKRLAHDVGKYIARTATNLRPGAPVPEVLAKMLEKDLYATDGERPASAIFDAMRPGLDEARDEAFAKALDDVREHLRQIDALEGRVRGRDSEALAEVSRRALGVRDQLLALLRNETQEEAE
ncbi:MAG: hypothetical protein AAGF12_08225 [Myxococcota bacterium]